MTRRSAKVLLFDSGLGGLTVESEVVRLRPDAEIVFVADDVGFPYGAWEAERLTTHVVAVVGALLDRYRPDVVVIACNTASTLVLPALRSSFPGTPFVGTVPAVKPAAAASRSKVIAVLATPGTVQRDYTRALIAQFAEGCHVELVGSKRLATMAEDVAGGSEVADEAIAAELAPCFVEIDGRRTDCVVLACTHYPLLLERFETLAPWPITWIDPAPAIARRVDAVLAEAGFPRAATETGAARIPKLFAYTSDHGPSPSVAALLASRDLGFEAVKPVRSAHSIVSSG